MASTFVQVLQQQGIIKALVAKVSVDVVEVLIKSLLKRQKAKDARLVKSVINNQKLISMKNLFYKLKTMAINAYKKGLTCSSKFIHSKWSKILAVTSLILVLCIQQFQILDLRDQLDIVKSDVDRNDVATNDAKSDAESACQMAHDANNMAEEALSRAENAKYNASAAFVRANQAQSDARDANWNSWRASSDASDASWDARRARSDAEDANRTAQQAQSDAWSARQGY